jgi:hypothetical protein
MTCWRQMDEQRQFNNNVQTPRQHTNPNHNPNPNPNPNPSHLEPKALAGIKAAQADTTVAAPVCRLVRFCLTPSRWDVIIIVTVYSDRNSGAP